MLRQNIEGFPSFRFNTNHAFLLNSGGPEESQNCCTFEVDFFSLQLYKVQKRTQFCQGGRDLLWVTKFTWGTHKWAKSVGVKSQDPFFISTICSSYSQ